MVSTTYAQTVGIDINEAREALEFPVAREDLVAADHRVSAGRDLLLREDTEEVIGVVPRKRVVTPYPEIMDWVTSEFDATGYGFKLRENHISKKNELYQEWLFDLPVDSPDGNDISPLVILRSSYTGIPLSMKFGTFRFVCRNGVIVGDTISELRIKPSDGDRFLESSIRDNIAIALDRFTDVADKYKGLQGEDYNPWLIQLLDSDVVPMLMKKAVMYALRDVGDIELLVEKLKGENLYGPLEELFNVVREHDAWYLYNVMTSLASRDQVVHGKKVRQFEAISRFFSI